MNNLHKTSERLGVLIVGLGGAVASTAVAGIELLKQNKIGNDGLPLASLPENLTDQFVDYENLIFGGWDLSPDDLATAALTHNVLTLEQMKAASDALARIRPWPALGSTEFCRNVTGENCLAEVVSHRESVKAVRERIADFRAANDCEAVVVNLASTEKFVDMEDPVFATLAGFEQALDEDSPSISPAMLYAYAAIEERVPYANFTPSVAADAPALIEFAEARKVPLAGKDGKTGQTFLKTVIAPALKSRSLRVDGWYSTNILGNRDGLALSDPDSLASKVKTKASVLDDMLGYAVEDHIVDIRYYRPRGDAKEAWDNIDVRGFLGQPMQIKINFLCRDSVLAAPLAIEIARVLDLARRRGEGGVQEQLSVFFKLPMTTGGRRPVHALHLQEQMLLEWLAMGQTVANGNGKPLSIAAVAAEQPVSAVKGA